MPFIHSSHEMVTPFGVFGKPYCEACNLFYDDPLVLRICCGHNIAGAHVYFQDHCINMVELIEKELIDGFVHEQEKRSGKRPRVMTGITPGVTIRYNQNTTYADGVDAVIEKLNLRAREILQAEKVLHEFDLSNGDAKTKLNIAYTATIATILWLEKEFDLQTSDFKKTVVDAEEEITGASRDAGTEDFGGSDF